MKTIKFIALAAIALAGFTTASAEDKIEGSVSADVVSRYIWRGQALGDAAIQPSAELAYKGFRSAHGATSDSLTSTTTRSLTSPCHTPRKVSQ